MNEEDKKYLELFDELRGALDKSDLDAVSKSSALIACVGVLTKNNLNLAETVVATSMLNANFSPEQVVGVLNSH
jgi:hypothetical protein